MRSTHAPPLTRGLRIVLSVALATVVGGTSSFSLQPAPGGAVPDPIVIGPIPAMAAPGDPSHDYPFFSTTVDVASHGYVEEEFFLEGTASRYDIPAPLTQANTPMTTTEVIAAGLPYRTRMIVRRPASAADFNGTVLMEWQNVSVGHDYDGLWLSAHEHIQRRGYAWIGVSAQRAGVHQPGTGLRAWSPSRYSTLDLTVGGTLLDDSLQYDVFSQAAQAVRNPGGNDPMSGFPVERILAVGISGSASRIVAYHNAVHPLAGVFDGFMPALFGARVRTDLDVKVFKLLSETDVWHNQVPFRQPNSDRFRRWELAGTSHVDFHVVRQVIELQTRDLGGPLQPTNCTSPPFSRVPLHFAVSAALDHMVAWVKHGVAPPTGPDIETTGTPTTIVRDSFGNALGGIRLPQHAVPTATNTGQNSPLTNFCWTFGSYEPFDSATLEALYPDHGTYLAMVLEATHEAQRSGYIVGADAGATIQAAARAGVGGR